jgi:quercetin dioxygenase-like cupin family protein
MKISTEKTEWTEGNVRGFSGKELLKRKSGTFKLVKIAAFSSYPEHIHTDKTEFAYVLEGLPEFAINSEYFAGRKGDFFIFPRKQKHAISNNTESDCLLLIGAVADK